MESVQNLINVVDRIGKRLNCATVRLSSTLWCEFMHCSDILCSTPGLRTASNMLIINLAASDLAFSFICGFPMMSIASFERRWRWGDTGQYSTLVFVLHGSIECVRKQTYELTFVTNTLLKNFCGWVLFATAWRWSHLSHLSHFLPAQTVLIIVITFSVTHK